MRTSRNPTTQALKLLMQDHRRIRKLVTQAERMRRDPAAFGQAVALACREIADHAAIEERFFYPALRALSRRARTAGAHVEHAIIANLAADLATLPPDDDRFLATFRVLAAQLKRHVEEEEDHLFEQAARTDPDLAPLLAAFAERQRRGALTDVDVEVADRLHGERGRAGARTGPDPQRVREPRRRGAH